MTYVSEREILNYITTQGRKHSGTNTYPGGNQCPRADYRSTGAAINSIDFCIIHRRNSAEGSVSIRKKRQRALQREN